MSSKVYKIPALFEVRRVFHPGGCERAHTHSYITVTAISNGSLSLKTGEASVVLEKDKTAIIFPDQQHFVESGSGDIESAYVIYINETAFTSTPHLPLIKNLRSTFQIISDNNFYEDFLLVCDFLLGNNSDTAKKETFSDWIANKFICKLKVASSSYIGSNDQTLAEAIKKILDNYTGERAPVDAISSTFCRSKIYCNRIFKAAYNLSIQTYFLNLKAHRAKDLLESAKNPIANVALDSGFYDQSHFTRVFKDIFQMTPEEFRQALKK
jgi:AraC-like DNA-binding protein